MKYRLILLLLYSFNLYSQILVENFDLSIETNLSSELQDVYGKFLNEDVSKISIVQIKKKYFQGDYYRFLKNKKFYQSRKKWLKKNSIHRESIIIDGRIENKSSSAYKIFQSRFYRVDIEFIQNEVFLDSTETKIAMKEMFNGDDSDIVNMCYIPRHAVIFYNPNGKAIGVYEICFECSNVKIGIVGTKMFSRNSPYIRSLFSKYKILFD
ncbi:hypothetical protein [Brumimicrobium mesophilum]|uniref:hypothetical protein n=1 Tax=Brumimicrobium mesophilum TaxID=392717 RepID=UPI00131D4C4C|nr:hypothetical protein [Brumimicrobium mesophilum]